MTEPKYEKYYVPEQSPWPIIGAIGLSIFVVGIVQVIQQKTYGLPIAGLGFAIVVFMTVGWFSNVINESMRGLYSDQMDRSFRQGMIWFIFSEVMFFAAFFGALFYARLLAVPWLAGEGAKPWNTLLWDNFTASWPLLNNPNPKLYPAPTGVMNPWGLPALNTFILVMSGVTITIAHHALMKRKREILLTFMFLTILLGSLFLSLQVYEYYHAYTELGLTLKSGIYGTTFFMLTGFHGLHVTLGTLILIIIFVRCYKNHFTPEKHFAFEASAWYWHFVDVVWLFLFIFVYWL